MTRIGGPVTSFLPSSLAARRRRAGSGPQHLSRRQRVRKGGWVKVQKCGTCNVEYNDEDEEERKFHTALVYSSCRFKFSVRICTKCRGTPQCRECPDPLCHCEPHHDKKSIKVKISAGSRRCVTCGEPCDESVSDQQREFHTKPVCQSGWHRCYDCCKDRPRCWICPSSSCHCDFHH